MIHGVIPALAEAGKIKIGGLGAERPKQGGGTFRIPVKLDHFLITKTTRDAKGDLELDAPLMAGLTKSHGDKDGKLRTIPIMLHSDVIEEVFPTALACYTGKKLHCRGDGKKATRKFIEGGKYTGKTAEITCPCPYYSAPQTKGPICKPHGTLHCSIASGDLAVAGAVHRWRTTSIISIKQMTASLEQIISITGTLRGVPLLLRVKPQQVTPNDGPVSTVYVCYVELRASDILKVQQHALAMAENRRALGGDFALGYRKVIQKPGEDEDAKEQEEVAAEFHNEEASNVESKESPVNEEPRRKQPALAPAPKAEVKEPEILTGTYRGQIKTVTFNKEDLDSGKAKKKRYALRGPDDQTFYTFSESAALLAKEVKSDGGTGEELVIQWKRSNYGLDATKVMRAVEADEAAKVAAAEVIENPDEAE